MQGKCAAFVIVAASTVFGLSVAAPSRAATAVPKGVVFIQVSGGALTSPRVIVQSEDIDVILNGMYSSDARRVPAVANVAPIHLALFWKYKYAAMRASPEVLAAVPSDSADEWADFQPAAAPDEQGIIKYHPRVVRTENNGKVLIESWGSDRGGQPWLVSPLAVKTLQRYVTAGR